MKKSLLALAVLGAFAGAAQAQTSISISGLIDMGFQSTSRQAANAGGADVNGIASNGSSTSTLVFSGSEDLGGGLKAGFFLATDFAAGQNNTRFDAPNATAGIDYNDMNSTFMNSQNFLSFSGGFGEFKLGNVNAQALVAAVTAQPFGTAFGGGYSGSFSRLNGQTSVPGFNLASGTVGLPGVARPIRTNNSVYYTSPNFSGFQATVGTRFKNDDSVAASSFGMQEIGLAYRAAGLNVVLARYELKAGANNPADPVFNNSKQTQTLLGANYAFGPLTVYGGWTDSDVKTGAGATQADANSYNVAVKYAVSPALAVMANYVNVNNKLVSGNSGDRTLIGLGADYSLSKRTTAYVRYERQDPNKAVAQDRRTDMAIGLRHTF